MQFWKKLIYMLGMLALAGCSGGGGNSITSGGIESTVISGTAAAGAPILGMVTVKDADGGMRTAPIVDGKYNIDVRGMKAPFKLKAEGRIGSSSIVCYSAALSTDVGGTINITPLTGLIIAQAAGEVAETYFAKTDTSKLKAENLAAETLRVRNALTDVLKAAGVETTFDLLRDTFNTDSTGLDKVMDIVKVTVDPATGAAQLKNILNDSTANFNVASPGTIAAITSPDASVLTDMDQIRLNSKKFIDLFATSIPSYQQIQALGVIDEATFKQGGFDLNGYYSQRLNDSYVVGIRFSGIKVVTLTSTDALVEVQFVLRNENHSLLWNFRKENGTWKARGDQRIAEIGIGAAAGKDILDGTFYYSSGFNIDIENPMNEAAYALVKGPGLPAGGVRLENRMDDDTFVVVTAGGGADWFPLDDTTISTAFATSDSNIPYTFELFASDGSPLATYTESLAKAPVTKAEIESNSAKYFAGLTAPATATAMLSLLSQLNDGQAHDATVSWTVPTGLHNAEVWLELTGAATGMKFGRSATSTNSATLPLQARDASGTAFSVQRAEYRVHLRDAFGREFDTAIAVNP